MKVIDGGVTAPKGFKAAFAQAGIKKAGKDMALILSDVPCAVAGTFTSNRVKASPVLWDMKIAEKKTGRACVINSGIANACTGSEGMQICEATAQAAADAFDIPCEQVLLASTGVIGKQIPVEKIKNGILMMKESVSDSRNSAAEAAKAIMTTDTVSKERAVTVTIGGAEVTVAGMCKGSGMIHPNMCTMLSFITTDAAIATELLDKALKKSVKESYNMISVDGDTSTNDTCLVFASGLAGNAPITSEGEDFEAFYEALHSVNVFLARKMAGDGEGATALFEVTVGSAADKESAAIMARAVVSSNLVKTAVAGHDANWGRILCAMGYSGADFDPSLVDLSFKSEEGCIAIVRNGTAVDYSEKEATKILSAPEVTAIIELHLGDASATAWGCDLTHEYVSINADYRS